MKFEYVTTFVKHLESKLSQKAESIQNITVFIQSNHPALLREQSEIQLEFYSEFYLSLKESFKKFEFGNENLKLAHRSHQETLRWVI